ncbi:MAG TPA: NAD-dependent epimerase/dehydratase family protein [Opitutales bacterium]|nr:NAD-dependent epimerase/dehydratase family protein [Opitutales bacterium]
MGLIIVTGAAGFIGSHTVDRLLASGHEVIGIDNFRTGKRENLADAVGKSNFRLEEADCANREQMLEIFAEARPTAVIHLAALVSVQESIEHPHENFRLNLEATHNVAIAAARAGATRIVFSSSAAVYGHQKNLPIRENVSARAISPYGGAKLAAEHLLRGYGESYGMTAISQRYFNVFGPRQDPSSPYSGVISIFQEKFAAGEPVTIFGTGRQTRDFVSVHDVARANVMAATANVSHSVTHNICTGRETSVLDLVTRFGRFYPDHAAPLF